jgi:hypothetical protein
MQRNVQFEFFLKIKSKELKNILRLQKNTYFVEGREVGSERGRER